MPAAGRSPCRPTCATPSRSRRWSRRPSSSWGGSTCSSTTPRATSWSRPRSSRRTAGWLCTSAAARQMIAQVEGGAICSVIASYAWTGGPGTVHSASAKVGLLAMTKTLAVEWAPHNIRVNTICPGPTDTEGAGGALWPTAEDRARVEATVPAGRLATVEEIGWWTAALCSPFAAYITGTNLTIDGGHSLEQESYM